jgi:hypothetical protein
MSSLALNLNRNLNLNLLSGSRIKIKIRIKIKTGKVHGEVGPGFFRLPGANRRTKTTDGRRWTQILRLPAPSRPHCNWSQARPSLLSVFIRVHLWFHFFLTKHARFGCSSAALCSLWLAPSVLSGHGIGAAFWGGFDHGSVSPLPGGAPTAWLPSGKKPCLPPAPCRQSFGSRQERWPSG